MKPTSVVNLDPIDLSRRRNKGIIGRLLVTRWHGGKKLVKTEPYGHYMFCGKQGGSKSISVIWYTEWLAKKYKKRKIKYYDEEEEKYIKFPDYPKIKVYSNVGLGKGFKKLDLFNLVNSFNPYSNEVRIVIVDEIHTYFPKDAKWDKQTTELATKLVGLFSQLRKRNTFVLSTAQIYGRLHKSLREQCLYMVNCKVSITGEAINEFIWGDDILCDDLGRWNGDPKFIHRHGLPENTIDSKKLIID